MLKRHYIYLPMFFALTSCSSVAKSENENSEKKNSNTDTLAISKTSVDSDSLQVNKTLGEPINVKELKGLTFLDATSGVLPNSESETFCKPSDHKFFGQYQLIDKSDDKNELIGQLVVSVPNNAESWTYENDYETFVEIKLKSVKIRAWKEIGVGTKETHLKSFIGDNFHYKKGTRIYAELGDYTLNANIIGDTINKLTIGKYCK